MSPCFRLKAAPSCLPLAAPGIEPSRAMESLVFESNPRAFAAASNFSPPLARRVKGGEKFDAAAKALGLDSKTSDSIARDGSIPGAASGKQLGAAFSLKQGDIGAPLSLGQNWFVYRVAEKVEADPANFEAQKKQLTEELLQSKREVAFEAFRTALSDRLKQEGKLKLVPEKLKTFGSLT